MKKLWTPKKHIGTGFDDAPIDWYEMMGDGEVQKKKGRKRNDGLQQEALFGDMKPAKKEKTINSDDNYIESTTA